MRWLGGACDREGLQPPRHNGNRCCPSTRSRLPRSQRSKPMSGCTVFCAVCVRVSPDRRVFLVECLRSAHMRVMMQPAAAPPLEPTTQHTAGSSRPPESVAICGSCRRMGDADDPSRSSRRRRRRGGAGAAGGRWWSAGALATLLLQVMKTGVGMRATVVARRMTTEACLPSGPSCRHTPRVRAIHCSAADEKHYLHADEAGRRAGHVPE